MNNPDNATHVGFIAQDLNSNLPSGLIDNIRRRRIDEVLNYDRDVNLRVFDLQRKQVAKMETDDEAQVSMQQVIIDTSNTSLSSFMVLIDKDEQMFIQ